VIRVEQLSKRYGDQLAVDDISFDVPKGEIVGFLGPNGAGKSTTLRMLTGYLVPNQGRIRIDGIDALADPVGARRSIGYMPESVPLYREMRVEEYLRYRGELKGVPRRKLAGNVDQAIGMANVTDVRNRIIGQLSKGYRSRVGLADALVADPPLLVLDEPTAGLDPNQIRQVRDLIRAMAGEKTVLLSTHILPEVESTCSRVVIINKGKLVGEGAPEDLRVSGAGGQVLVIEGSGDQDRYAEVVGAVQGVRRIMDREKLDSGLVRLRIETGSADVAERVFAAVAEAGLTLRELHRQQTSLEDVFASLTTVEPAGDAPQDVDEADDADEADKADDAGSVDEEGPASDSEPEAEA